MAQPKGKLLILDTQFTRTLEQHGQGNAFRPHAVTPKVSDMPELGEYEEIWVDVDLVDDNPTQPRVEMKEADQRDLTDDINTNGQMQSGGVREHPKRQGRYQMIYAHRRKYAIKDGYLKAGTKSSAPVHIRANAGANLPNPEQYIGKIRVRVYKNVSDLQMRRMAISENTSRVDLKPMEVAKSYRDTLNDLTNEGRRLGTIGKDTKGEWKSATTQDVAAFLGKKLTHVHRMLRLLELPENMQKAIENGTLNARHGRALLDLAPWPQFQDALFRDIKKAKLSGQAAEDEATRRKNILLAKQPNEASAKQEQEESQIERADFVFDPDAEREAQARRAELADVLRTPEQQAALELGATPGNTDSSQVAVDIAANALLNGLGVTGGAQHDGPIGGHGGNHNAHYRGLTKKAIAEANSQPPQIAPTNDEELARRMGLAKSAEIGLDDVDDEFKDENLQVTPPAPVETTATNGVAQVPRLESLTRSHMHHAVENLEWASTGFNVLEVAPEDVAEFGTLIARAEQHLTSLKNTLVRHQQRNESS